MIIWDYSHPQYNVSLDKLNCILHRNRVNIFPKCSVFETFFVPLQPKGCEFSLKYVFIMARPIKETPILYGEDARRFEARMKERRRISPEERAEMKATYEALKSVCDFM